MIPYKFTDKHKAYMRRALECTMNVAEGAVRSGKTVDNVFVFAHLLETTPDRLHLASGATGGTAKVTLGDCGGFGLEAIFRGRSRWHSCKGLDAMTVQTPTGEKTVLFVGGKNADAYKHIRGLSIHRSSARRSPVSLRQQNGASSGTSTRTRPQPRSTATTLTGTPR